MSSSNNNVDSSKLNTEDSTCSTNTTDNRKPKSRFKRCIGCISVWTDANGDSITSGNENSNTDKKTNASCSLL